MTTTMNDTKYNGWTNYETWNVALWLGNEQSTQTYWNRCAEMYLHKSKGGDLFTKEEQATLDLSDEMKDQLDTQSEDNIPKGLTGFYLDLLNGALREVNWHEIAKHYIEAVIEEREYQSKKGNK